MKDKEYRIETDPLGSRKVPLEAYYGVQTVRAMENFPISGIRPCREFIRATGLVKKACALANMDVGWLDPVKGGAIVRAASEIVDGLWHDQFVVDVFQAGAGTSHNMNANEVIANRAIEILGGKKGDYSIVHPNDHVNMAQSTNDVFPTKMRVAVFLELQNFIPALDKLIDAFYKKAREFDRIIKSGRTHLQDAVPVRLGQEFHAYGKNMEKLKGEIINEADLLKELGIGGTAAGTGINTHPQYRYKVVDHLSKLTGIEFRPAQDLMASMQSMKDFISLSGKLRVLAVELIRIANDIRLLSSGPRTGLYEIVLPPLQPGSSIMPGKINPVMAEALNMVCFQVIGNDTAISYASQAGQLELNVMMPVINYNLLQTFHILTNALNLFADKCIYGIRANEERCKEFARKTLGLATALNPVIGYKEASSIALKALKTNKTIEEIVRERGILSEEELRRLFDPYKLTSPQEE